MIEMDQTSLSNWATEAYLHTELGIAVLNLGSIAYQIENCSPREHKQTGT